MPTALALTGALHPWLDVKLFSAIHPALKPAPAMLAIAECLALGPLVLAVLLLLPVWLAMKGRDIVVEAVAAASLGLVFNWLLGTVWYQPRPFLTPGIRAWMNHATTSSFPSDHLTVHWCIAGVLLGHRRTRRAGLALAALGLPMAWARIYLGVHYPIDMLGAAVVAICLSGAVVLVGRKRRIQLSSTGAQ